MSGSEEAGIYLDYEEEEVVSPALEITNSDSPVGVNILVDVENGSGKSAVLEHYARQIPEQQNQENVAVSEGKVNMVLQQNTTVQRSQKSVVPQIVIRGTSTQNTTATTGMSGQNQTPLLDTKQSTRSLDPSDEKTIKWNPKMKASEIDHRKDHNYSDTLQDALSNVDDAVFLITEDDKIPLSRREKIVPQIKNITDLKKVIPRVKLQSEEAKNLADLKRIAPQLKEPSDNNMLISEEAKQQLNNYCRTCAGLKLPLVDIFGERGVQMRLSQQMQHLENISKDESLTTQMCMDCICDLKMSYKFFMQIKKAEVKLKSIHMSLNDAAMKLKNSQLAKNETVVEKPTDIVIRDESESQEEPKLDVEPVLDMLCEDDVATQHSDDNESIEEFDPEDPPFHPDSSDGVESDDLEKTEIEQPEARNVAIKRENNEKNSSRVIYTYDSSKKTYVKVEPEEREDIESTEMVVKTELKDVNSSSETKMQPNILKRKLSPQIKTEAVSDSEGGNIFDIFNSNALENDSKKQKLDVNNPINIGSKDEEGIMYVTVKGSKPNELLLVKVKKMDKSVEKKDDKNPAKKTLDAKPRGAVLKKFDAISLKDKDIFSDRTKKPDKREQIIEEQIEEYKKRRDMVLGGNNTIKLDGLVRVKASEYLSAQRRSSPMLNDEGDLIAIKDTTDGSDDERMETKYFDYENESQSPTEKTYVNSGEYLARLARLKQKWDESKIKRESLQKESEQPQVEGSMDKLARILGDRETNLQDFQEYLKQRKIVITRLKDEDIVSLYEDKNNTTAAKNLVDPVDEVAPTESIPLEDYLECDYCLQTFASQDTLEEHLKSHDFKIMHYCENCDTEFTTNKAKKNHNVICLKKLICKVCDMLLDSKGKKRQHEQKHCDNLYGQLCDICGEKFKHQGTLDQHVKTQHMNWEKVFECPKCPKKFAFKQKLTFHLKSVHTTMRAYLCEDCGADFKNPASLRHHRIRKHQPVGNKRECQVCHKMVPFYSLSKHMHTHKAYTIQCPHCDKMFKNTSTLKQHVRIHEDQRQYRCDMCGVGFNRRDGLRLHMRVHEKADSRGLKECCCQICGEKFPNHSMLVIHRNRVHKDGRQYTCHICNRSMISTRSLEWHMSHIHNECLPGSVKDDPDGTMEKKRVTCYHCDKTFKTEMILRTHIKNTHMKKNPMKCLDCEETFTSEVRLRHHMMVSHNRLEGTLSCPHCPKRFVNQLRLKTHMISHSEDRPYTCEICGFNLKTKIQLIKHHQNRHSDERPLQCRYCPWRCKQVSALVCHERTHTNERPYACSVCRQRFKYLGDKNKHERRHESLGGSGFKRIVTGRNNKQVKAVEDETSGSEQEHEEYEQAQAQYDNEEQYEEQTGEQYEEKYDEEHIVKYETQNMEEGYEQTYEQEYEETSREASEAAEVIMNMEDTTVYTEEVTADNMESAEIITDEIITNEIITNQILQTGTVVHLQQQDDSGKIQVIPVMLSLPDLSDTNTEVNIATASIMYNN